MKLSNKPIAIILAILGPSIILRALAMDILLSCVPSLAEYFEVEFCVTQWLLSLYFVGAGIGQLFLGPLSDEFGRRKILLASTLLIIIASFACSQITDIYLMMLMRFLQGLGACGTTVVSMAIMRDLYEDNQLPRIYSYFNGIVAIAPLLAPLLGSILLLQTGSWRSTFYFITVFSIVALVIDYFYVAETNPRITRTKTFVKVPIMSSYITLLKDREFLSYCAFDVVGMSSLFLFFSMSSILLIKILGLYPDTFGYYFSATSVMYLIGNMISPKLQTKLTVRGTILIGSVCMLLAGITMLAALEIRGLTILGIIIPNALSTFGVGLLFGPCMAGVVKRYRHIAGIASATYGAIFLVGSSLLVAAIMQLEVEDSTLLGISLSIMGLFNIILMLRMITRHRSRLDFY